MARIQVSFKNNDKELKLYDEVMRAYDKSAFVKGCIQSVSYTHLTLPTTPYV